jgi:hypothetical protein
LPNSIRLVIHIPMKAAKNKVLTSAVAGGVIPMPRGVRLTEGMRVQIVPLDALPSDPPFLKTMLKLADQRQARKQARRRKSAIK